MPNYQFFQNRDCEFFPCHAGIPEEEFNCLFCYCPLYCLKENCGGNCRYTDRGIKDCSACTKPHFRGNYEKIMEKMKAVMELVGK